MSKLLHARYSEAEVAAYLGSKDKEKEQRTSYKQKYIAYRSFAGTAEDAKMFLKYAINRASSTGALDNVRMAIETAMIDGLVGSNQVLRSLPQKRAFLQALHPKDCLRLLNMVRDSILAKSAWHA